MKKYALLLLIMVLLFSCNHDSTGIFYGISKAEPVSSSGNLPSELTGIYSLTSDATNVYVSGKQVYKKALAATAYSRTIKPDNYTNSSKLASDGTNVYALWSSENGASQGLFTYNGTVWSAVAGYDTGFNYISLFETASGTVYVQYINAGNYIVEPVSGTAISAPNNLIKGLDTNGSDVYIMTRKEVYKNNDTTFASEPLSAKLSSTEYANAFLLLGADDFIVGTTEGRIIRYSAGTWSGLEKVGTATGINDFILDPRDTNYVFIATDADGLSYALVTNLSGNDTPSDNYLSTDLIGASVTDLYSIGSGISSQLYAGSTAYGLWKLSYDTDSSSYKWTHENSND